MSQTSREDFSKFPEINYREVKRTSNKIIFLSCEGAVTEEEYFQILKDIFSEMKHKIEFVSVVEDIIKKDIEERTQEEEKLLSQSKPHQLVEKMDKFKSEKQSKYHFSSHEEDEFWIITDVDDHTDENKMDANKKVSKKALWDQTIKECEQKKYQMAVSNPFFELWLLLHHTDVAEEDYQYAVTAEHPYEKTSHFKKRLKENNAMLHDKKHICRNDYNIGKVKKAVERARQLHSKELENCQDDLARALSEKWPHSLGSTVYKLLENIIELYELMSGYEF